MLGILSTQCLYLLKHVYYIGSNTGFQMGALYYPFVKYNLTKIRIYSKMLLNLHFDVDNIIGVRA